MNGLKDYAEVLFNFPLGKIFDVFESDPPFFLKEARKS
jgi:hypothetical protein